MGSFSHRLQIRSNRVPVASWEELLAVELLNSDLDQVSELPPRRQSAFTREVMTNGSRYRHEDNRWVQLRQCGNHCGTVAISGRG